MIFQSNYYLWMNRSSTLSQLVSIFLRSVSQRLDAVQEILESNSITLNPVRSLLSHLPDLDRGICSIYHRKVRVFFFNLFSLKYLPQITVFLLYFNSWLF